MLIIGVDPGLTGALALYLRDDDKVVNVIDIPTCERAYGKGLQVNWRGLNTLLQEAIDTVLPSLVNQSIIAVLENVGVMPAQGAVSGFQFGRVIGGLEALFETLGIPVYRIHPATWKKQFGLVGSNKHNSIDIVLSTYPETKEMLTLAKHHNRAESILIAVAGSRLL